MSATIRTTCPIHNEVDLDPEDIVIVEGDEDYRDRMTYVFYCSKGSEEEHVVTKEADRRIIMLLESAGVKRQEVPIKPGHPEAPDLAAQPLTSDDLLEFHEHMDYELMRLMERQDDGDPTAGE